jgi:hypothetical protein
VCSKGVANGVGLSIWTRATPVGACGSVMAIGRRFWTLSTALHVHVAAAPVMAFLVSAVHKLIEPAFGSVLRATVITGLVFTLDILVVAPIFERNYAMFLSPIGTWIPFVLIFLASLAAGIFVPA